MPIVPAVETITAEDSVVTLARYIQIINYPAPCAFWGVRRQGDIQLGCRTIWQKSDRDMIQRYLAEAQQEIEQIIGYPLGKSWITDEVHTFGPDAPDPRARRWQLWPPVLSNQLMVIEGGVQAISDISLGEPVDHLADPAIVGPLATTVTDTAEIRVYHPGTNVEIDPSAITISGGNMTITIPRCRMVLASLADNPKTGIDYTDTDNFEQTVDVKRLYNDPSTSAEFVWKNYCDSGGCSDRTQTGCIYVEKPRIGVLNVRPATYTNGSWRKSGFCYGCKPDLVKLNYAAGLINITSQVEDAIVRLAHSKMPQTGCGCDIQQRVWERDRNIPAVLTKERVNCPFGLSDGSWFSWQQAEALKIYRMSVM